jgi:hypothetical protein
MLGCELRNPTFDSKNTLNVQVQPLKNSRNRCCNASLLFDCKENNERVFAHATVRQPETALCLVPVRIQLQQVTRIIGHDLQALNPHGRFTP